VAGSEAAARIEAAPDGVATIAARHKPGALIDRYESEGFIAEAIDLPGCSAFGETQSEAIVELQNAIKAWIAAATAAGNAIPPPRRKVA
jgi:predicted RNase H-like HicB family nuclease